MWGEIFRIDHKIVRFVKKIAVPAARLALFVVFFYFGSLKLLQLSPADPLVATFLSEIMPFVEFEMFSIFLGVFEMVLGTLFVIPGAERLAFLLLLPHMISTFLPLVFLPDMTWARWGVPTLEGQYIIKNLLIISLALGVVAHLHPLGK